MAILINSTQVIVDPLSLHLRMVVADVHPEGVLGAGDARAVRALVLHAEVGVAAVHVAVETAPVLVNSITILINST